MHSEIVERPVVELTAARKVYARGESRVVGLDDVSLTIHRGEYVAVIGASGSGKSTLLNVIGTLDALDQGSYRLDGHEVAGLSDAAVSRERCHKIGFVFQAFHLLPRYTARDNVELPMVYAGVPRAVRRERALEALARVGLAERADHLPSQLSGGQQQRVSIARALVQAPKLLLADEPTGALDSKSTSDILALFDALHHDGATILLVTHDANVARHTRRIVTMKDGRIVADEDVVHEAA